LGYGNVQKKNQKVDLVIPSSHMTMWKQLEHRQGPWTFLRPQFIVAVVSISAREIIYPETFICLETSSSEQGSTGVEGAQM
jgi:hypothetical protein